MLTWRIRNNLWYRYVQNINSVNDQISNSEKEKTSIAMTIENLDGGAAESLGESRRQHLHLQLRSGRLHSGKRVGAHGSLHHLRIPENRCECRQDTHSQHTSVQYSLFTSAERTPRAWHKSSRIAFHLYAREKNLSSGLIHVSSLLVVASFCSLPRAHHLPLSLFLPPRHKNTQHNRYNTIISKNTQYLMHISKFSQSTSSAIKHHSGVKPAEWPKPAHDNSHTICIATFSLLFFSILRATILIGSPDLFFCCENRDFDRVMTCTRETSRFGAGQMAHSYVDIRCSRKPKPRRSTKSTSKGAGDWLVQNFELNKDSTSVDYWICAQNTLLHCMYRREHCVHTVHCTGWLHAHAWLKVELCSKKNILSFHLLFRAMAHDLDSTPSTVTSFLLFSFTHRFRLKVDHVWCTLRQFTRPGGEGFMDPQPRTGYEPNRSSLSKRLNTPQKRVRFQKLRISSLYRTTSHCCLLLKILLEGVLCLKKQTWTTNKFVLCWLHRGACQSEKQVRNDHKFITLKQKVCCQVHLKVWTS